MPVLVAQEDYYKIYKGRPLSGACCCCWLVYLVIIFLPLIICLETNNFWQEVSLGSEAIDFKFRNEFLIYVLEDNQPKVFSNLNHFEQYSPLENQLKGVNIEAISRDYNDDGISDKFEGKIEFLSDADNVEQCMVILFFDSYLRNDTNVKIQGQLKYDLFTKGGVSNARIYSRIELKQRMPIPRITFEQEFYSQNVFEENNYDIIEALKQYERRDYRLQPQYNQVITGGQGSDKTSLNFEIQMDNTQQILLYTRLIGRLKFALIQFLCLFIPFWVIGRMFLRFLFRYKFFLTYKTDNLPPDNTYDY